MKYILLVSSMIMGLTLSAQKLPSFANEEYQTFLMLLDNEISINVAESDPSKIELRCKTKGTYIKRISDTLFTIRFTVKDPEVKLKLYYKKLPVDIITGEMVDTDAPVVRINGKAGGEMSFDEFSAINEIAFDWEDENVKKLSPNIYSYKVIFRSSNRGKPMTVHQTNTKLNRNFVNTLKRMKTDFTAEFTQFMVRSSGGQLINLAGKSTRFDIKF